MKNTLKTVLLYAAVVLVIIFAVSLMLSSSNKTAPTYGDIIDLFTAGKVTEFDVNKNNLLVVKTTDGTKYQIVLRSVEMFREDISDYLDKQLALPAEQRTLTKWNIENNQPSIWLSILPYAVMTIIFIAFWIYMTSKVNRMDGKMNSFSRAHIMFGNERGDKVFFSDVAGCEEEKQDLREIVDYLRDPSKYRKLGAKIPHGVLLVGPPGTGKTLLAKAVAGEAGVPFLSISASDFVEMYVGVGASRVRDLFETAKRAPASIIFIDEIDAVGRHRGAGLGGGHDEREQTLNQLLVEMDGFGSHDGVIVMAATNRPDILDPALLRPGRFDRQVTVGYPDINGREEILKVHARNKPFEQTVDFSRIAQTTVGFTGADLANLLNEAALLAARKNKSLIGEPDIEEALIKVTVGTQKKSRKIKESEKKNTAYHEAGHAVLAHLLPTQDPVREISIIPSGRALGYTLNPPVEDKYSEYKQQLIEEITMLLGGRAAEEIVFGDVSGGASNDIMRATQIAKKMVTVYGMSELGTIRFGSEHDSDEVFLGRDFNSSKDYSEETAALIDEQIKKIVDSAYADAKRILSENRSKLDFIVEFLLKYEVMDDRQFNAAMNGASMEEVEQIGEERRRKSEEENALRAKADEENRRADEERRKAEEARRRNNDDDRFNHIYGG
ncbi:MAG: ATP-dependent zinc metalloprotease FtsH [Eubacteriales bacterium]|nr:ATP-dependent zinc metalloprotease FtsH [Eubacterium sp.]MDY5493761.1 ATP-dependent zinc metalloprotease FtsH [Eubacteriales bacterium]